MNLLFDFFYGANEMIYFDKRVYFSARTLFLFHVQHFIARIETVVVI